MAEPGTERIAAAFASARGEGRAALMPYMVGGFPDHEASLAVAAAYADAGADLIELGVPFSDPLADGPVIHAAATAALEAGATLDSTLEVCASVSGRVPVLLMAYSNMILARGPEGFAAAAAEAGAAGAIVPDLSFEECPGSAPRSPRKDLPSSHWSRPRRREAPPQDQRGGERVRLCGLAVGVTGERGELPPELADLVVATREEAPVPAAVGFGIGTPEQAASVGEIADGVIIGSRLVREVSEGGGPDGAEQFLAACRAAMS